MVEDARVVDIREPVSVHWVDGDFEIGCDDGSRKRLASRSVISAISHWSASSSEVTMGIGIGECSLLATSSVLAHLTGRDHKPSRPVTSRTIDKTISLTCSH